MVLVQLLINHHCLISLVVKSLLLIQLVYLVNRIEVVPLHLLVVVELVLVLVLLVMFLDNQDNNQGYLVVLLITIHSHLVVPSAPAASGVPGVPGGMNMPVITPALILVEFFILDQEEDKLMSNGYLII